MDMTDKWSSPGPASNLNRPFVVIWGVIQEVREPRRIIRIVNSDYDSFDIHHLL